MHECKMCVRKETQVTTYSNATVHYLLLRCSVRVLTAQCSRYKFIVFNRSHDTNTLSHPPSPSTATLSALHQACHSLPLLLAPRAAALNVALHPLRSGDTVITMAPCYSAMRAESDIVVATPTRDDVVLALAHHQFTSHCVPITPCNSHHC